MEKEVKAVEQIWIGLFGSLCIAGLAYWKRSLSGSGAMAAILLGTVLYASSSLPWFGTMIAFFVSSSALSKWKQQKKEEVELTYEKTGRRDALQVLANGGIAVLLGWIHSFWPQPVLWFAFLGVMATVNADTWATEIGSLSKRQPIFILSGKRVPRGTSGAVSRLGILATMAGGLFIGLVACMLLHQEPSNTGLEPLSLKTFVILVLDAMFAGTIGALFDSILGASVQRMYQCVVCGKEVEKSQHCGQQARPVRGLPFFNNDTVNAASSLLGGLAASLIACMFFQLIG